MGPPVRKTDSVKNQVPATKKLRYSVTMAAAKIKSGKLSLSGPIARLLY
jgi:hypothetical protein